MRQSPKLGAGTLVAEHKLRLLDLAYDAIFVIDVADHRISYWSHGAERLYGHAREEAVGRVSHELLQTRYPTNGMAAYDAVARAGHWEGRLVQTRKDGRRLLVDGRWDLEPETGRILEINRDVTDRVTEQERFQVLVSSVRDYAIFLLDPRGHIVTWNEGARRINGFEADEVIGRHISIFYAPDDIAEGKPGRGLRLAVEAGRFEDEGWRLRKDGSRFWADVVTTALRDPAGGLTGYANVTRDITERQLEHERLEELERSKSTFLNLAAHELRAPLSVIRGYLSILDDPESRQPAVEEQVVQALNAKVEDMSRLVDQMVEVARIDDGSLMLRLQTIDLASVVEQSVADAQLLPDPSHPISVQLPPGEVNVRADPERVRAILRNLLSNAIKYSPQGGPIEVGVYSNGTSVKTVISDRGIGIREGERSRLFSRFARLDPQDGGMIGGIGLGLYVSRELARMHGGDLVLEESSRKGSRFALHLPLASVA